MRRNLSRSSHLSCLLVPSCPVRAIWPLFTPVWCCKRWTTVRELTFGLGSRINPADLPVSTSAVVHLLNRRNLEPLVELRPVHAHLCGDLVENGVFERVLAYEALLEHADTIGVDVGHLILDLWII